MPGCSWEKPQPSGSSERRTNLYSDEIRAQWNFRKIFTNLGTEEQCIWFSEERGLLPTEKMCTYHKKLMTLELNKGQVGQFRCRKGKCRNKSYSRAAGTWFENARLPLPLMFQIMYSEVLSQATIADWFNYCREAIIVYQLEHEESREKIGGPGKIVQIDENVEGHWVLGMIEDDSDDLRLEVCPDNQRNADVLVQLIKKQFREGSTIHTDFWKAYDCLPEHGYIHKNHWRVMKRLFSKDNYKSNFTEWLIEHIWRRNNRINHKDQFEELLVYCLCL
ncbi:hypothetical protein ABMA28_017254 [Loxostege sticticalis]|uniref:ISXO2-like transposase domain-containing protein n=1 Tax=Loxostege sticticalis TaxID=481309 RepID=A0ABD0S1X4_LOXSC